MERKIQTHSEVIRKIDKQRRLWLILSAFVFFTVGYIIYAWHCVHNTTLEWTIGSLGMVVGVTWWYWTMRTINTLLHHRMEEVEMIEEVFSDLKEVYKDIKELK